MASALAMDKIRSKRLFKEAGIATPDFVIVEGKSNANLAAEKFGYPLILKPSNQGSSVGMTKVFDAGELSACFFQQDPRQRRRHRAIAVQRGRHCRYPETPLALPRYLRT